MEKKRVHFKPKVDIGLLHSVHFVMSAIEKDGYDVEITIEYGAPNPDGLVIANVYGSIYGDGIRSYLCTEYIPKKAVDEGGYMEVAHRVRKSRRYTRELEKFYNWALEKHLHENAEKYIPPWEE